MAVPKADEYQHNNPDRAFVDSRFVRGGRRTVADRAELYALVAKADQLEQDVTIVRIKVDSESDGQTTDVMLVDASQIGKAAGWEYQSAASIPSAPSATRVDFENTDEVTLTHGRAVPPRVTVFDADGYELLCQQRVLGPGILEFQFNSPESGFIIY
jgi:hypothetical protein